MFSLHGVRGNHLGLEMHSGNLLPTEKYSFVWVEFAGGLEWVASKNRNGK